MPSIKICNCSHNEYAHGGLPLSNGYEPKHCTFPDCQCDEFTPIKLTHAELCKLGQIFHASNRVNVTTHTDARIAEWIKDRLSEVEQPHVEPKPLSQEMLDRWQVENGSVQAIRKEGPGRY